MPEPIMTLLDPTDPAGTLKKVLTAFNDTVDSTDDSAPKQVRSGLEKAAQESLQEDENAHGFAQEIDEQVSSAINLLFEQDPAACVFLEDLFSDLAKRIKNEADYQIHVRAQELAQEGQTVAPTQESASELVEWFEQAETALETFEGLVKMFNQWDSLVEASENWPEDSKDEPPLKKTPKRGWTLNKRNLPSAFKKGSNAPTGNGKAGRKPIIGYYRVEIDGTEIPENTDLHYVCARLLGEPGEVSYRDFMTAWTRAIRGPQGEKELHATPGTSVKFAIGMHTVRMYVPENK